MKTFGDHREHFGGGFRADDQQSRPLGKVRGQSLNAKKLRMVGQCRRDHPGKGLGERSASFSRDGSAVNRANRIRFNIMTELPEGIAPS